MTKKHNAPTKSTGPTPDVVYRIAGTQFGAADKETLKPIRRKLNAEVGVYEVETKIDGKTIEATPSNQWPFRLTKGEDHPHKNPLFGQVKIDDLVIHGGQGFRKVGFDQAIRLLDNEKVRFGNEVRVFLA